MLLPVPCVSVICAAAWNPVCLWEDEGQKILRKSGNYFGIIFLFAVGAALGGHMIGYIGARTIWISHHLLLISFLCMFIKEERRNIPRSYRRNRRFVKICKTSAKKQKMWNIFWRMISVPRLRRKSKKNCNEKYYSAFYIVP